MTVAVPEYTPGLINPATDSWTAVLTEVGTLANSIAATEFVPGGLRGSTAKVAAAILYGRELGLPPMTSLSGIQVISGKPALSAEMMRALILAAGHQMRIKQSDGSCTIRARRREEIGDDDAWQEFTFTTAQARKAGLTGGNWDKYEPDMLLARATSRAARAMFADVTHGLRTVEEVEDYGSEPVAPVVVTAPARLKAVAAADSQPQPVVETSPISAVVAEVVAQVEEVKPEPLPVEAEPVEAELLELATVVATKRSEKVTQAQLGKLMVEFDRLGLSDRTERLRATSDILGRELTSAKDMSKDEASIVIDTLAAMDGGAA